uniref:Large ribosomal subunit protein uL22 n=1 Tax='Solanum tuberosum' phytoplasma TaxID=1117044 RepID=K9LHL8_9MOLU|nr:ribosomal protein L22 ['Solanum tuberosum' phytoplasma]
MNCKVFAKKIRIAPRKIRLVIDLIRGKDVKQSKAILMYNTKSSSKIVLKLLNSAIANIKNNLNFDNIDDLYIKEIFVNEGIRLKRIFPRAKGSSNIIKKRTSEITLLVSSKNNNETILEKK